MLSCRQINLSDEECGKDGWAFKNIDLERRIRGELFRLYMEKMPTVMSPTVDVGVAPPLICIRKRNIKFYPAMLWAVSKVINSHDEFKYEWDDDVLILWDFISPSCTAATGNEGFIKFVTEYDDSLTAFCDRAWRAGKYQNFKGICDCQAPTFRHITSSFKTVSGLSSAGSGLSSAGSGLSSAGSVFSLAQRRKV